MLVRNYTWKVPTKTPKLKRICTMSVMDIVTGMANIILIFTWAHLHMKQLVLMALFACIISLSCPADTLW